MDVFFEPQKGRPFSIEVGFFDSVLEIKEKIQKYQGIPINKQTLVFNGQVLQDERDVGSCEILQNSRIHLVVSQDTDIPKVKSEQSLTCDKIQLNVKTPSSKIHVPLEMDAQNTVLQLKEKINEMEPVPISRQVIQSNGEELQDHRTLRECELQDNSEINVITKPSPPNSSGAGTAGTTVGSKKLRLMVLPSGGSKKIPVEVNPSDNVGELRKELQKLQQKMQFHLRQDEYFFIYKQNVMDDDRSFRWHHVNQGDTIEIFNGSVTGGN